MSQPIAITVAAEEPEIVQGNPQVPGGRRREAELLASCYRRSLELAVQHSLKSIAFPAISCGAYGYPLDLAAPIAVKTVRSFERLDALEQVLFVCAQRDVLAAYERVLAAAA